MQNPSHNKRKRIEMNRRDRRRVSVLLATLWTAVAAQAQEVHKCTINGQVTYQAKPCPAGDAVLSTAPTPSDRELREAKSDLYRQRLQAATGHIYEPVHPTPPPPSVQTTTTYTVQQTTRDTYVITRRSHAVGTPPAPAAPTNCEKLNHDSASAKLRRDQLRSPSDLRNRQEQLQRAEDDLARVQQLAQASNCKLVP
jgi:hypothetical protein